MEYVGCFRRKVFFHQRCGLKENNFYKPYHCEHDGERRIAKTFLPFHRTSVLILLEFF